MRPHPWPLFDLVLRDAEHRAIELRLPTDAELVDLLTAAKDGIHPPDYMPFSHPWTDTPSPELERSFFRHHWGARASWTAESWNLLLALFVDGTPMGAQDLLGSEYPLHRTILTASWLTQRLQGQGLGRRMRRMMLDFAFHALGAEHADTAAREDNVRSLAVTRALGYQPNGEYLAVLRGAPVRFLRYRIDRRTWLARGPSTTLVEGLEGCLDMFGTAPGDAPP